MVRLHLDDGGSLSDRLRAMHRAAETVPVPVRRSYVSAVAERTLRAVHITEPPVSVQAICAHYAYTLVPVRTWSPGTHSAQWQPALRQIRFNAAEPAVRQRFSIAHEIGHVNLGHEETTFSASADPESDDFSEDPDRTIEAEADAFAGELLLPPAWVKADWKRGLRWAEIATRYMVSEAAAAVAADRYRLLLS